MTGKELTQIIRTHEEVASSESLGKRLDDILKERKPQFIASVLDLIKSSEKLANCEKSTIWNAAIKAAIYDLPIDPNLGFAYIIPYGTAAQFQMGARGIKQLALRSGRYKVINTTDIREGEIAGRNRLTGIIDFKFIEDDKERLEKQIIGYLNYFEMHDGYSHTLYMSIDELMFHATRYSKAYQYDLRYGKKTSPWSDVEGGGFGKMCEKTVMKLNLSKNGILSVQLIQAFKADGSVINDDGEPENADGADEELKTPKELEDLAMLNNILEANINEHEAGKQPEPTESDSDGGNNDEDNQ